MKKIVFAFLVTALALCMCLGVAACGEKDGEEPEDIAVTSVTLNKTALTLDIGGEETLTATVAPDDATDKAVTWTSDHPEIAAVANGKVTAIAEGSATITAAAGGKSATCAVTVNKPDVKMSAAEWTACVNAFGAADNFYEKTVNETSGRVITETWFDGDKIYYKGYYGTENALSEESAYEANGGKYYEYSRDYDGATPLAWTKSELTAEDFADEKETQYFLKDLFVQVLSLHYDDMVYAGGGKYTLAQAAVPDMTDTFVYEIEITVTGGKITLAKCLADYYGYLTYDDIGSTVVTIPTV